MTFDLHYGMTFDLAPGSLIGWCSLIEREEVGLCAALHLKIKQVFTYKLSVSFAILTLIN